VRQLRDDGWELFSDLLLARSFPAGIERVRAHRKLGHRTVLLTGALDFVIEPLRPLFDDVLCASLGERHGTFTGELTQVPPTGEARALLLAEYAEANDASISEAVAYADSASDLPMLEAVGHPVAVNPDRDLLRVAREHDWEVVHFERPVRLRDRVSTPPPAPTAVGATVVVAGGLAALWWRKRHMPPPPPAVGGLRRLEASLPRPFRVR